MKNNYKTKRLVGFIKRASALLVLLIVSTVINAVYAQVSVTATVGTTGPTTYTTVNAAFGAINAGTHQGAIVISVTGNTTETAPATQLLSSGTGSSSYTSIVIQPVGDVTINSAATPTASRGVLEFIGADNVTIDGDDPSTLGTRNLTIQVASTTLAGTACLRFSSVSATANGCTNIIVKNTNIVGGRSSSISTTTSFGIFSGLSTAAATITTASGAADNDNMLLENNNITRCYYGIYCYGITAYAHDNLVIRNNTIGSSVSAINNVCFRGIYIANTQTTATANSAIIEGNDVQGGEPTSGISTSIAGIDLNVGNAGAVVRKNNIHDVKNPSTGGWGSYGLIISSATSNTGIQIYNNFIRDIIAFHYLSSPTTFSNYGIFSSIGVTGLRIVHNTIVLNQPNAGSGNSNISACLYLSSTAAVLSELRNNIFVNNQSDNTGQVCMAVYIAAASAYSSGTAINRNNYWASGASGYVARIGGVNHLTLSSFKSATLKDSNALNFNPTFLSATDLHLVSGGSSPFESAGDTTWLTVDYDGDARPGPAGSTFGGGYAPDLGADEADMGLPTIASMGTGGFSNVTTNAANLVGNIINNGGSNIITSGIVISTSPSPTRGGFGVIDSATNPLVSSGSFSVNVTGLNLGTTYYYRSYGVNAIGTAYGPDSMFTTNAAAVVPTVQRIAATGISGFAATVGGNITTDGGSPVFASGVVYSTSPNPVVGGFGVIDSATTPTVTGGIYSKAIGGMTHSTKYYFRAYATNAVGTGYSAQDSFTTQLVVTTLPYTENFDSATTPWTSAAINTGTNSWVRGTPAKTNINGAFSAPNAFVTTLTGNYLGTEDCVVLSPQMDFTTLTTAPILRFKHKMDVDADLGWDGGVVEISINGGAWTRLDPVAGTAPSYNTANSNAWYNSTSTSGTLGSPKWSVNTATTYPNHVNGWITSSTPLTGAAGQSNVRVRFRFWADGGVDEGWALDNIEVFQATAPVVSTGTKSNITTSGVTLAGTVVDNGGNAVSVSGVVVGTSPNPTRGTFGVTDSATNPVVGVGSYTVSIVGLNNATTYYYRAYAVNGVGITYGADSIFTTNAAAVVPSLTVSATTGISGFAATLNAGITSDGGSPIFASGIVYSTTSNPSIGGFGVVDSAKTPAVTSGVYSVAAAGLTHTTKYYFRAYATNSVGTGYSAQDSFTTQQVITTLPYAENFDNATTSWTAAAINAGTTSWVRGTPAKTNIAGPFSAPNAFATNLTGNYVGTEDCVLLSPQMDFTAMTAAPILRFKHNMDVDADLGWDGGVLEISINGGAWTRVDATAGTAPSYNTANSNAWYNSTSASGTLGSPKWSVNTATTYPNHVNGWITSSTPLTGAAGQSNVRVRFRFWADGGVDEGWALDNIEVFQATAPTVETGTKSNVTTSNATLTGNITSNGGNTVTASGIVYGTSPTPTRGTFGVTDSMTNPIVGTGAFTINVTGLTPSTTYYYRAYAVNAVGTTYGADSTFTTPSSAIVPTIINAGATAITTTTATLAASISSDGGSPVFASGVVYSTSPNPVIGGLGVIDSTTSPAIALGALNVKPTGLTHSTKYYYRGYATNSVGTAYAQQDSFTTSPIVSTLPYTQGFEFGAQGWNNVANTGGDNWVLGTPAKVYLSGAHTGTKAWVTKTSGNYDDNLNSSIVSPQFDLTGYTSEPVLRFYHKFKCENGWDGLVVEISINGGAWTKLDPIDGTGTNFNTLMSYTWYNNLSVNGPIAPPKFSTANGSTDYSSNVSGWVQTATRLTGAAGQSNVRFRFTFGSDASGVEEGWAIDDIEVINVLTPTVASSNVTVTPSNTSANVSFSPGNGEGRLVVARLSTATAVAPFDTVMYTSNAAYGSGSTTGAGNFVVYVGTGTSVNVTNLASLTGYSFDVYEFNGKYMHNKFASSSLGSTTTTPVKLLNFVAVKKSTDGVLSWVTASEVNNKGFEVERSTDGKTFEAIDFVFGKGNSNSKVSYSYTDARVFSQGISKVYYRLKQVDNDGKYSYSSVVMLMNDLATSTQINAYPNPFTTEVTVSVVSAKAGQASVEVYDISGRKVLSNQYDVVEGNNALLVTELNKLHTGIYFVKVQVDGQEKVIKMAKN